MKNEEKYIGKHKINVLDEPCEDLNDDLPEEIDFSKLRRIDNPLRNKAITITLEPDIAKHFKNSKQFNQFLRLQIKSLEIIK